MGYNSQHATWGTELSIAASTFTGSFIPLSTTFTHYPSIVIIQNDTDVTVALSSNATTTGISFVSGTKLVLDMQSDRGVADFFSFATGEQWYASGAAGTGTFHIAYIYGVTPA